MNVSKGPSRLVFLTVLTLAIATRAWAQGPQSDDFNACVLDPIWTFVDPQGDATAPVIQGAFTGDSKVAITVPGGTAHELFNGDIDAPHIIQPAADGDFTLEVKFDSLLPATNFAEQGIVVRQDASTWIRLEFFSQGTDVVRILAGLPDNSFPVAPLTLAGSPPAGTSPLYMRIQRVGDDWTLSYSFNGSTWTQARNTFNYVMNVTGVGLYAGNAGDNPEHTVLVDYFSNTADPVDGSDDTGLNELNISVVGTGTVDKSPDQATYACGTEVTLTPNPGPDWTFDSWSGDVTGTDNPLTVTMNRGLDITANFVFTGPPVPPVANDDVLTVDIGDSGTVDVLANDSDPNGDLDPSTVTIQDSPFNGTITGIDPVTGEVTYLHDGGIALVDSFTYTVEDDTALESNTATVRVTVNPAPPAAFISDDFNACELKDFWTFVDPLADATDPFIDGPFSGDARLSLSVPGGSAHEPVGGVINAPHILQPAANEDFTLEVKWDSPLPPNSFAEQGVLIKENDGTWVRFDFASQVANLKIVALTSSGSLETFETIGVNTVAPTWMRIQRVGDVWTQSWSTDGVVFTPAAGTDFTFAMTVTEVGLFTGNAAPDTPAHTALVDYFSNADVPVDGTDDTGLNAPVVAVVGTGAVARNPDLANYACGDPVELTAAPDPGWVFAGWSGDTLTTDNPITVVMDRPWDLVATFTQQTTDVVAANTTGVAGLSTALTCAAAVPVEISRQTADPIKGFSLTLGLTGLDLCAGLGSIVEGPYLSTVGLTDLTVTDNLNGTWDVEVALQGGQPCGATAAGGTLLTVDVTNTIADGTGLITISNLSVWDCSDQPLDAQAGPDGPILVDTTPPAMVENLAVGPKPSSNPPGKVFQTLVSWTDSASPDAAEVTVYRALFGPYPEYDDLGGVEPVTPVDPVAEGWNPVNTRPVANQEIADLIPLRNYWYYCAVTRDALGNESAPMMAGATLNYLLGDVSNGGDPIVDGDNTVGVADLSFLGTGYGTQEGDFGYKPTLDIGPTNDMSVNGLPATDNRIDFEDLILFSLNYAMDANTGKTVLPAPAAANVLMIAHDAMPPVGESFAVRIEMAGAGDLQGLQVPLTWDPDVVRPLTTRGGPLLDAQGGDAFVLNPEPGLVDIALAGKRPAGISGTGELATVVFRVLAEGDPAVGLDEPTGRDAENGAVDVAVGRFDVPDGGLVPLATSLRGNYPNPFNPMTTIAFDLAKESRVRIAIYGVDGRLVREVANGHYAAGRHEEVWDGRDADGRGVASGTYLYVMESADFRETRRMLLLQ